MSLAAIRGASGNRWATLPTKATKLGESTNTPSTATTSPATTTFGCRWRTPKLSETAPMVVITTPAHRDLRVG